MRETDLEKRLRAEYDFVDMVHPANSIELCEEAKSVLHSWSEMMAWLLREFPYAPENKRMIPASTYGNVVPWSCDILRNYFSEDPRRPVLMRSSLHVLTPTTGLGSRTPWWEEQVLTRYVRILSRHRHFSSREELGSLLLSAARGHDKPGTPWKPRRWMRKDIVNISGLEWSLSYKMKLGYVSAPPVYHWTPPEKLRASPEKRVKYVWQGVCVVCNGPADRAPRARSCALTCSPQCEESRKELIRNKKRDERRKLSTDIRALREMGIL